MTDIVERLRDLALRGFPQAIEAAAEIERLRRIINDVWPQMQAERDALRAALNDAARELHAAAAVIARLSGEPPA
jgi:uncharacterized membrane-anchored protein